MRSGWNQTTESSGIPPLYVKHDHTADGCIPLLLQTFCVKEAPENGAEQERRGVDNNATCSCSKRTMNSCDVSKPCVCYQGLHLWCGTCVFRGCNVMFVPAIRRPGAGPVSKLFNIIKDLCLKYQGSHADREEQHTHPTDITLNIHVTFNNLYLPFRRERGVYEHHMCTCR